MKKASLLYNIFYKPGTKYFYFVNNFLALTTIVAVLVVVLETVPLLSPYGNTFFVIEWIVTIIFTIEYFARILANKQKPFKYIFSFFGIIDLVSIIPTILGLGNLTFLKTARTLRILRLLRIIRLSKLIRIPIHDNKREENKEIFKLSVQIYLTALLTSIIIFGTLMYVAEGSRIEFQSIPEAMIWSTKVTLGGISQHTPETLWGELIVILTRFSGLLLFGLLISIVGTTFKKLLLGSKD